MWFNLAWFGREFRHGDVKLATGGVASVRRFVEQGHSFVSADIKAMVAEQYKIMQAVIPIHRQLQDQGQIEVSTTPFYHPILPLLVDTDQATIDRPGTTHPRRFAHPEDAEAHVRLAVEHYQRWFGRSPRGMWPAEGAVSPSVIPLFARHGLGWIATDKGVLARSGRWGYRGDDPDVLCQPYRAEEQEHAVSIFFRDTQLSDAIGFRYHSYAEHDQAAWDFLREIKERFAWRVTGDEGRVLAVVLDGENAWSSYREDARPFLRALYELLERDSDVQTVTFAEVLEGNPPRGIVPHEINSAPGVDLGTWIGEEEENRGWELLSRARDLLSQVGATPETAPDAFQALYMAQGSDWFWWFGEDQDSGNDGEFDELFRVHVGNVYRSLGIKPPPELEGHIVPHTVVWSFAKQVSHIQRGSRLTVRTNCSGVLTWQFDRDEPRAAEMVAAGGVMAGVRRYHLTLGPFPDGVSEIRFRFRCACPPCDCHDMCRQSEQYVIRTMSPQVKTRAVQEISHGGE
jgi:alpha-amylase/alpha-mannosidase (GH57 family)